MTSTRARRDLYRRRFALALVASLVLHAAIGALFATRVLDIRSGGTTDAASSTIAETTTIGVVSRVSRETPAPRAAPKRVVPPRANPAAIVPPAVRHRPPRPLARVARPAHGVPRRPELAKDATTGTPAPGAPAPLPALPPAVVASSSEPPATLAFRSPLPTVAPTRPPTTAPTLPPTTAPTLPPTTAPTLPPTTAPTPPPTSAPTLPPTSAPTQPPTTAPTLAPASAPTHEPTIAPTRPPTTAPTRPPTNAPTLPPTTAPTRAPTQAPTIAPVRPPTTAPTSEPSARPAPDASARSTDAPARGGVASSAPTTNPSRNGPPNAAGRAVATSSPGNAGANAGAASPGGTQGAPLATATSAAARPASGSTAYVPNGAPAPAGSPSALDTLNRRLNGLLPSTNDVAYSSKHYANDDLGAAVARAERGYYEAAAPPPSVLAKAIAVVKQRGLLGGSSVLYILKRQKILGFQICTGWYVTQTVSGPQGGYTVGPCSGESVIPSGGLPTLAPKPPSP